MKFYQKLDGAAHVSAREYDVAHDAVISEGQLVKLSEGLVVGVGAGETEAILGIAAENHSGTADAIDPRADGAKIFVIDDPSVIMQCKVPEVAAAGGSATTLEVAALKVFGEDDFKGGYVKLVRKAEDSKNTDVIGKVRRIKGFAAGADKGTLTLEDGGTPAEDDVYALFPPVGFDKGDLSESGTSLVLTTTTDLPLKVAGHDRGLGKINLIAKKHIFAAEA